MNEELDILAAEYALGTLPADERARFELELQSDPELREALRRWQARFAPLDEGLEEAPPASLWTAIERRTRPAQAVPATSTKTGAVLPGLDVAQLRRRIAFWRAGALGAGALATALAAFVIIDRVALAPGAAGGRYVAVVDADGEAPALIAAVDTRTGTIRIRSLAAEIPAGSSLELWHVAEGHEPRSLGLLQAGPEAQTIEDAAATGPVTGAIAVSVEPEGGSPSGAPTGPIVYSGELVALE